MGEGIDITDAALRRGSASLLGPAFADPNLIESGASTLVYRATQVSTGRVVAVKLLLGAPAATDGEPLAEASTLASLSWHPHILTLLDAGRNAEGIAYLVTEFAAQGSAAGLMTGTTDVTLALQLGADLISALEVAHDAGIIHGDVKPANLLVGADGRGRLADFGIASNIDTPPPTLDDIRGTLNYLAPEQLEGGGPTPQADVHAAALTIWSMVEGKVAFGAGAPAAIVAQKLSGTRLRSDRLSGHVRSELRDLADVLDAASAADPDERPPLADLHASVTAALAALDSRAVGASTTIPSAPGSISRSDRRASTRRWLGSLAAIAIIFGLIGFVVGDTRPRPNYSTPPVADAATFCKAFTRTQEQVTAMVEKAPGMVDATGNATEAARILMKDLPKDFATYFAPTVRLASTMPELAKASMQLTPSALSNLALADGLFRMFRGRTLIDQGGSVNPLDAPPGQRATASAYTSLNSYATELCDSQWSVTDSRAAMGQAANRRVFGDRGAELFGDPSSVELFDVDTLVLLLDAVPDFVNKNLEEQSTWLEHLFAADGASRRFLLAQHPEALLRAMREDPGFGTRMLKSHPSWVDDLQKGIDGLEQSRRLGVELFWAPEIASLPSEVGNRDVEPPTTR